MSSNNPPNKNPIAGAITYPAECAGTSQSLALVPVQPRQPRNLQGLLKFAMEATKAEDASGNSHFGPMAEERYKFLADALAGITVDLTEVLTNCIEVLTNTERIRSLPSNTRVPQEVKKAFTVLLEVICDIDAANDFYKLGGFAIFPICYGSQNSEARMYASAVLAEMCQNNPFCQAQALECGFLTVLLTLAQTEKGDALAKCLYALSCCSREYEPACRELLSHGVCEVLAEALRVADTPSRAKAAFFIAYLCKHYSEAREQFLQCKVVATVAEILKVGPDRATENLLSVLVALLDGQGDSFLDHLRDPDIGLKVILESHLHHPDLIDEGCREQREYCQKLLCRAYHNCPSESCVEEMADR